MKTQRLFKAGVKRIHGRGFLLGLSVSLSLGVLYAAGFRDAPDGQLTSFDGTEILAVNNNAGTAGYWSTLDDIFAQVDPKAHSTTHSENAADEILAENLGTACSDGEVPTANATGGLDCETPAGGGGGEANTASNLGGGLANFDTKSGVDLRFNSFAAADFDLAANLISIDNATWLNEAELDTFAELDAQIADANLVNVDTGGVSGQIPLFSGGDTLTHSADLTFKTRILEVDDETFAPTFRADYTSNSATLMSKVELRRAKTGPAIVVTDDNIGEITFEGYDGTVYDESARISAIARPNGANIGADLVLESKDSALGANTVTLLTSGVLRLDEGEGIEFTDTDTENPGCAAGEYRIYADTSDAKLKKCENGSVTDMDTAGGAPGTDSIGTDELDDDANSPTAGDFVIVETGGLSFNYRTPNVGTDVTADLEEEVTLGSLSDGVINEPDLAADNAPTDGDILTYDSTGTDFAWITPAAGTDVTADLEEEGQINASNVTGNAADDQLLRGTAANTLSYVTIPDCNSNNMLTYTQSTNSFGCDADDGAGGGAPVGVQYVVGAADATLTAEKILTDGTGIDTVLAGGDGGTATINLKYTDTQGANPALNAEECVFTTDGTGGGILCEGSGVDTNEGLIQWNPTTDVVVTIPDATGTAALTSGAITDTTVPAYSGTAGVIAATGATIDGSDNFSTPGGVGAGGETPTTTYPLYAGGDQNALTSIKIENLTSGTAAVAGVELAANGGTGALQVFSSAFTSSGADVQDGLKLEANSNLSQGLNLVASDASGTGIRFWTNGGGGDDQRVTIRPNGVVAVEDGEIVFIERASHVELPQAGEGYLWVRNDTPSSLVYTDDAGTDYDLTVDDDVPEAGDYSNLTGGTAITNSPTGTVNLDTTANVAITGDWDFGGGGIEIENGTTPPACTVGQLYLDTDATSGQQLMACEGGTFVKQGDGTGGTPAFSDITTGTNTTTLTMGTGGTLNTSGSGVIEATNLIAASSVVSDAEVDDTITVSNYLPLAAGSGSPLTGDLYMDIETDSAVDRQINLRRARAGPAVVADNDILGDIRFHGYDGSAYQNAGFIRMQVDGTPAAGDIPSEFLVYTQVDGSSMSLKFGVDNIGHTTIYGSGGGATAPELRVREAANNGTNYVAINVPAISANYTLTLPVDDGTANQLLQTNGSGALSWTSAGATPTQIKSITVEDPTATEDISIFFTSTAITISEMRAVVRGTTPSVTWTIRHNATDRSVAGNEVVTSGTTTTSESAGSDVTSFNDATIPADSFVWLETTGQTGTVDELHVSIIYTED